MNWRWASASVIGTSHIHNNNRLQDAHFVSKLGNGGIFAIVSDGAGSATFGAFGAWLTCRHFVVRVREWVALNHELPTEEKLQFWLDELRDWIANIAINRNSIPRQFAATLAAVIVGQDEVVTIQIGDSGIVGRKSEEWNVLCWPQNGEYASSTYFVTDNPEPRVSIERHLREYDSFALFSDGIGDLALSHLDQTAHPRFFNPMMHPVDSAVGVGRLVELSAQLSNYLASPPVCERTDDDKTLILISGK